MSEGSNTNTINAHTNQWKNGAAWITPNINRHHSNFELTLVLIELRTTVRETWRLWIHTVWMTQMATPSSHDVMYLFTTVPHPHGHWQLQELLGNQCYHYIHMSTNPAWTQKWQTHRPHTIHVSSSSSSLPSGSTSEVMTLKIIGLQSSPLHVLGLQFAYTPTITKTWWKKGLCCFIIVDASVFLASFIHLTDTWCQWCFFSRNTA